MGAIIVGLVTATIYVIGFFFLTQNHIAHLRENDRIILETLSGIVQRIAKIEGKLGL
jgi:hypothetical protein